MQEKEEGRRDMQLGPLSLVTSVPLGKNGIESGGGGIEGE